MPRRRRKPKLTKATFSTLRKRLANLEGRVPTPPDPAAEARWQQDVKDLDEIARIISSTAGDEFDDLLSQVAEHHPHLSPYQRQLEVKRILILRHPDGERLWRFLKETMSPEYRPIT